MAYRHAAGYWRVDSCSLVACADFVRGNAEAFANHHHLDHDAVYEDHAATLDETEPDVVSGCVPPSIHANLVVDSAETPSVDLVQYERPMATTWGDCQRMGAVCDREDVQLTIDHQRRLAEPLVRAKELLDKSEIDDLRRLEWSKVNLFDAGSHLFDLCDLFVDGDRAERALAAIDCSNENRRFGALNETRAISRWRYPDGSVGFAPRTRTAGRS